MFAKHIFKPSIFFTGPQLWVSSSFITHGTLCIC